ncbi:MAG: hypothetical protein ACTJLK_01930 [Anaplasma sp.]
MTVAKIIAEKATLSEEDIGGVPYVICRVTYYYLDNAYYVTRSGPEIFQDDAWIDIEVRYRVKQASPLKSGWSLTR